MDDFAHSRPAWVGEPLVGMAELRRRQGRPADATRLLDDAGRSSSAELCRARMALDRDDRSAAAELLERLLRRVPPERMLRRAPALELLVRARVAEGQLDGASGALAELRGIERRVGTAALRACADLAEGGLAAAEGDHERARALLEDAVDRFQSSGGSYRVAEARIELAVSLAVLGRAEAAEREASAALETLLELGAVADAERARRILARAEPPGGHESPLSELTPREREVLALLAQGLTNRAIAERLVVSEHTVHRHVTNILRKLELSSRTAAAALAARSGLLGAPRA